MHLQMTGSQAIKILDTLMEDETVCVEHIAKVLKDTISKEAEDAVIHFHSLLCTAECENCAFSSEEFMKEPWKQQCHIEWADYMAQTAETLDVSIKELEIILYELREIIEEIQAIMEEDANIISVLKLFINSREGLSDLNWRSIAGCEIGEVV